MQCLEPAQDNKRGSVSCGPTFAATIPQAHGRYVMVATFPLTGAAAYSVPVPATKTADWFFELGRFLFALGLASLGVQIPLVADFVRGLEPVPAWLPLQLPLAYLTGAILLGASLLIASGLRLRLGALAAALLFLAWFALLQLPRLATDPGDGNAWTAALEVLALLAAAWLVVARAQPEFAANDVSVAWAPRIFGACLLGFGTLHFVYHDYVASVIPAWIPAHMFFAYFTGVAHIAAGIALITGVQARLAGVLLGAMFVSWVVLLHIPRVAATPGSRAEWTSLLIAITLSGAAWLVAGNFARKQATISTRVDAPIQPVAESGLLTTSAQP